MNFENVTSTEEKIVENEGLMRSNVSDFGEK